MIPDSPIEVRWYCPGCEPDADPIAEMLAIRRCGSHDPGTEGELDRLVHSEGWLSGSAEAEGRDNKRFCDLIHRQST